MALIKCPECGKEISDRSELCIHCGFPIAQELEKKATQEAATRFADWEERIKRIEVNSDFDEKLHDYLYLGAEGSAHALFLAGHLYESRQNFRDAIECYQRSYELDSSYEKGIAMNNMGHIYANFSSAMFNPEKAFQCMLKSQCLTATENLGLMYDPYCRNDGLDMYKDVEKAIKYYKKAIWAGTRRAIIYNNLGILYGKQNDNNCVLAACYCLLGMRMEPTNKTMRENYSAAIRKVQKIFPYFDEEYIQEIKTANDIDPMINRINEAYKAVVESHKIHCPNCNSTNVEKISSVNRTVSIAFWGLASSKIGKQYKCRNCGQYG